jgi:hypothetical protein
VGQLCPEAPPALCSLVDRMLAKQVRNRILDCATVVRELDALGLVPETRRRSSSNLTNEPTSKTPAAEAHCLVLASTGHPDDQLAGPSPEQAAALTAAAAELGAQLEFFASGAIAAHLKGPAVDTVKRAASLALAMRKILPAWSIAVSASHPEAGAAGEQASSLLASAAIENVFGGSPSPTITVDRGAVALLDDDFEIAFSKAGPTLRERKRK